MFKQLKRSMVASALLLVTIAAGSVFGAGPAVLEQVPGNASVVVVVKDLKATSSKISNLATRINVPGLPPDLLGAMSQRLGITKGLDQNGSAAFFATMPLPPQPGETAVSYRRPYVLLLPTSDAKGMLESFQPTAPENGISEVTVPGANAEPGYVATVGNFVAFAQDRDFLQNYLENKKETLDKRVTDDAAKSFNDNDVAVYANVSEFGPAVVRQIDQMLPMIRMMMRNARQPGVTDAQVAMQQQYVEIMLNLVRSLMTDTNAAIATARLSDAGATLGLSTQFKPDSELGKMAAAQKPLASTSLEGLPAAGPVLLAGAATWNSDTINQIISPMFEAITNANIGDDDTKGRIKAYFDLLKQSSTLTNGIKFAAYAPKPEQKGLYHVAMLTQVSDASKMIDIQKQLMSQQSVVTTAMSPGIKQEIDTSEPAQTVKGLTFSSFTLKVQVDPDAASRPDMQAASKILDVIYGGNSSTIRSAAVGTTHVLTTMGLDAAQLEQAATAAQTDKSEAKAASLNLTSTQILPNASTVMFVSVDRWISVIEKIVKGQDPAAAETPADQAQASPMVISAAATGSNVTMEAHLPVSLLNAITQRIKEAQGQPQGPAMGVPAQ